MPDSEEARQRVIEYLKIKPINHGQLDIAQIYVPSKDGVTLLPEYVQVIHQFKANLHPIIVRRTDQYGEDQEYELVYGGDWYQAAKAGGLTKIWVWVFDLTDEQVAQVQQLLGSLTHSSPQTIAWARTTNSCCRENRAKAGGVLSPFFPRNRAKARRFHSTVDQQIK